MSKILLMDLHERIKTAREHVGLTIPVFARRVGVSKETARLWEDPGPKGIKQLRDKNYDAIVKVTGVNRHWLVTGVGSMLGPESERLSVADVAVAMRDMSEDEVMDLASRAFEEIRRRGKKPER